MSQNRPKIYLDKETYIYRKDYNVYSFLQNVLNHDSVPYIIDAKESCRKFKTKFRQLVKNENIYVTTNENPKVRTCMILRIDCNQSDEPEQLQVEDIETRDRYVIDCKDYKLIKCNSKIVEKIIRYYPDTAD